ncbi:nucleoside triphosphate pyrophosphohydrolase family protein [Candidatus Saccharibacteria bacterium]|nr:nucleoside triphosphate pyrophosphohydrolase family protein [Candidatus Saccharibacteria bacterium]
MKFDEYQEKIIKYDTFSKCELKEVGFVEKVLGLTGEAGETADKIKKILRDKNGVLNDEDREAICKELGDTLWYLASIARYLDLPLSEVAEKNVAKLEDRYVRNKIHGAGDER